MVLRSLRFRLRAFGHGCYRVQYLRRFGVGSVLVAVCCSMDQELPSASRMKETTGGHPCEGDEEARAACKCADAFEAGRRCE